MNEPMLFEPILPDSADHNANTIGLDSLERFGAPGEVGVDVSQFANGLPSVAASDHACEAKCVHSTTEFGVAEIAVDGLLVLSAELTANDARAPIEKAIPARISRSMGKIGNGRQLGFCALLVMLLASTGCNGGLAAAVASSSNNSASANTPSSISTFTVDDDRQGTATIRFFLIDAEGDRATVELAFQLPGGMSQPLTTLVGAANPALFVGSANGTQHTLVWNYAAEVALPSNSSFVDDVQVSGFLPGVSTSTEGVNSETRGLGNDVPVVLAVDGSLGLNGDEAAVVPIQFTLADSSEDAVNVVVEFLRENEQNPPGQGWQLATPATLTTAPPEAFVNLATLTAAAGGVGAIFFWDTDIDLFQGDEPVRIRFTPRDDIATGLPAETASFQVDNNEVPTVSILEGLFQANPEQLGILPIPYRVTDKEGDEVQVVFQWRQPTESFPVLPSTVAGVQAAMADPVQRRALQIATEFPTFIGGRVVPVDANTVRLPELATGEAPIRLDRIVGCELQILRASDIPSSPGWPQNPLDRPVSAIPIGEGFSAYTLDANGTGNWRLREVELATGVVLNDLATGFGTPTALALSSDEQFVFVASFAGLWQVDRVDLTSGVAFPAGSVNGSFVSPDGIRGIAALGNSVALMSLDDSLLRVDFSQASPTSVPVLTGLAEPWGIAIDPLQTNHAYLALRTEHRVVDVDLNAGSFTDLPAEISGGFGIPLVNPRAIALERGGARLLVVTQRLGGEVFLRGLDLRASTDLDGDGLANPAIFNLEMDFDLLASIATGEAGLRMLAVPDVDALFIGGGIEQSRSVEGFDPARHEVRVTTAFQPVPGLSKHWRIPFSSCPTLLGSNNFAWDSRDVLSKSDSGMPDARFILRVLSLDSELGGSDETSVPKSITSFGTESVQIGGASPLDEIVSLEAADLDGDGDMDFVSANSSSNTLTVFFQSGSGVFNPTPLVLGDSNTTIDPFSVRVADLDGDGDQDIVSANRSSDNLTVFFQISPGVFDPIPLVLGDSNTTARPSSVEAADLDGDGNLDLISANGESGTLTVFSQIGSGVFDPAPLVLRISVNQFYPPSVIAADVDGDGKLDLVFYTGIGAPGVFFQIGPGVFGSTPQALKTFAPSPYSSTQMKAVDLDGDGKPDLVSSNEIGGPRAFPQIGPGVFDPVSESLGGSVLPRNPSSVAAADLDGDGNLDLVYVDQGNAGLIVAFQTGPGVFDPTPLMLGGSSTTFFPLSAEAADLDGDGDLDLVASNQLGDSLAVFIQSAPGVFDPTPLVLGGTIATVGTNSVTAADFDGDGKLDLVSARGLGGSLTLFIQSGSGAFDPAPLALGNSSTTDGPLSVDAADLDGDGDLDIVSAIGGLDSLAIFFQSGPGVFDPIPLLLGDSSTTDVPVAVDAADLDGDGDLDLVSANRASNSLTVFFQSSPGVFDPTPQVLGDSSMTAWPSSVEASDLDGDGKLDLVSANRMGNNLTVFFQSGPGVFDPVPLTLGGPSITLQPRSVKAADLDGDGDQDIVSANRLSDNLTVFFQSGPGVFSPSPLALGDSSTTEGAISVEAADMDGDGDLDLVSANELGHTITVFFQSGPGVFGPVPLVLGDSSTTNEPQSVKAADLDGDGDLDLISGNEFGVPFALFFQSGPGVFDPVPQTLPDSSFSGGSFSLDAADLDGDGDLEIISAIKSADTLKVFWNRN